MTDLIPTNIAGAVWLLPSAATIAALTVCATDIAAAAVDLHRTRTLRRELDGAS